MNFKGLFSGIVFALVLGLLVWQVQVNRRLKADREAMSTRTAAQDDLRDENSRLKQSQIDPAELERLRRNETELLRLRGETAQLRQQLKTLRDSRPPVSVREPASAVTPVEEKAEPVQTFTSTVRVPLAPGQSLVTGGWTLPGGKRGVVLVEPSYVSATGDLLAGPVSGGQVLIESRFIELPDVVMSKAGLDSLRAEGKETSGQARLDGRGRQVARGRASRRSLGRAADARGGSRHHLGRVRAAGDGGRSQRWQRH